MTHWPLNLGKIAMSKIDGYLKFFGLEDWWLSTFTREEREYIENVISPGEKGSYLTKGHIDYVSSSKIELISGLASRFINEVNSGLFLKICREAESLEKLKAIELHFHYLMKIEALYVNIDKWPDAYPLLKEACYSQITISAAAAKAFKKASPQCSLPSHRGFKRLAIILQNEKRYSEVVRICKKALSEQWPGDWDKRICRNDHKTDEPTTPIIKANKPKGPEVIRSEPAPKTSMVKSGIPELTDSYPMFEAMSGVQKKFYKKVETELNAGRYIDVEGANGYVLVYLYRLLNQWNKKGFENLHEHLTHLAEMYANERRLSTACLGWANDCLLGAGRYTEYLDRTEPSSVIKRRVLSNLRLNIQRHIGIEANPVDLLSLIKGRSSPFIVENQALYKENLLKALNGYSCANGGLFSVLDKWSSSDLRIPHKLFSGTVQRNGAHSKPCLPFDVRHYFFSSEAEAIIGELSKAAENDARSELGVPLIGEGWVSETALFSKLKSTYPMTRVIQHGQPSWLGMQHYDIWFPHWKVAVEYHGKQHFEPVPFFGGEVAFLQTVERDNRKVQLSKMNGVKLIVVKEGYDYNQVVSEIDEHRETLNKVL